MPVECWAGCGTGISKTWLEKMQIEHAGQARLKQSFTHPAFAGTLSKFNVKHYMVEGADMSIINPMNRSERARDS